MEIREFHWLVTIIQNLEVGLVVLDKQNQIEIWNSFMESHSSRLGHEVKGKSLFDLYPEIDKAWLCRKLDMVKQLNSKQQIILVLKMINKVLLLHICQLMPAMTNNRHIYQ